MTIIRPVRLGDDALLRGDEGGEGTHPEGGGGAAGDARERDDAGVDYYAELGVGGA